MAASYGNINFMPGEYRFTDAINSGTYTLLP
jgi:hypothetical protein